MINKQVSSLSEYISIIEKNELFDCISRGENQRYEHPLRSGIHRKNFSNYLNFLEQYHLNVENSINQVQEKNFLAFSQHHGIPTNLLDFSFSPLVSLYFSTANCNDKGYVYFINKSKTININKVIYKKPLGWGLLDDLLSFNPELYKDLQIQLSDLFILNREEIVNYFEKHAENFIKNFDKNSLEIKEFEYALRKYKDEKLKFINNKKISHPTLCIDDSYSAFIQSMQKIYTNDIMHSFMPKYINNYNKILNISNVGADYIPNIHIIIFLLIIEEIKYYTQHQPISEIEIPFYFTYTPPIIDDRVRNQSSIFIFQPFETNKSFIENTSAQLWQKIIPDFTIEIQNPNKIRKELDSIGFNLKHVYCDFDSISKYIVNSF